MTKPEATAPTDTPQSPSQELDASVRGFMSQASMGLSPLAMARAFADWQLHAMSAPGRQMDLLENAWELGLQVWQNMAKPLDPAAPADQDSRFADPAWNLPPYRLLKESYKAADSWWRRAAQQDGMINHHQHMVEFFTRQALDAAAPSNWALTNPEIAQKAIDSGGASLAKGYELWLQDMRARAQAKPDTPAVNLPPLPFEPGKDVAVTPGKVVFRNHLIELIQYSPQTEKVHPEPVLIVPSCIMKYYILDLSPHNSMVRYLVSQGHTVFIISWRNPDAEDRELKIQDYLSSGLLAAMAATKAASGAARIHTVGYCLGGTFLAMVAAVLGRIEGVPHKDLSPKERALIPEDLPWLGSVTLLAAQTDFSEPGEIGVFIDESQLATLRQSMQDKGYLSGSQMGGSFQFLAARDMVWTRNARRYFMGEEDSSFDLMSWNSDTTRLPARMHNEYLSAFFLNNALVNGQYRFAGKTIALIDIRAPMMVVGTVRDHVSPWRSVYKIHLYTEAPITFVLVAGGHNAGIVSEPGRARRSYQIATSQAGASWIDPDEWAAQTEVVPGSWWEAMHQWLAERSAKPVAATAIKPENIICDAPGSYVMQRYAD